MESPTSWYFTLKDSVNKNIIGCPYNTSCIVHGTEVILTFEHIDIEKMRLTLHWLTSGIKYEEAKTIVSQLTGDYNPDIYKLQISTDAVNRAPILTPPWKFLIMQR